MGKFGKELIESLKQAAEHAKGNKVRGMRFTKVELPDVKAIRPFAAHVAGRVRSGLSHPVGDRQKLGARAPPARRSGGCVSPGYPAPPQGDHGSCWRISAARRSASRGQ